MKNDIITSENKLLNFLTVDNFVNPLKDRINKYIEKYNVLIRQEYDNIYVSYFDMLKKTDTQPKAGYTKHLSPHIQSNTIKILKNCFPKLFNNEVGNGFDMIISDLFIEIKCSNNIKPLPKNVIKRIGIENGFDTFSGNNCQIQKIKSNYFLLLSYGINEITGFISSMAIVLVKMNDSFKEYYCEECKKQSKPGNTAQLSIKIPVILKRLNGLEFYNFKEGRDFWCINCKPYDIKSYNKLSTFYFFTHN